MRVWYTIIQFKNIEHQPSLIRICSVGLRYMEKLCIHYQTLIVVSCIGITYNFSRTNILIVFGCTRDLVLVTLYSHSVLYSHYKSKLHIILPWRMGIRCYIYIQNTNMFIETHAFTVYMHVLQTFPMATRNSINRKYIQIDRYLTFYQNVQREKKYRKITMLIKSL